MAKLGLKLLKNGNLQSKIQELQSKNHDLENKYQKEIQELQMKIHDQERNQKENHEKYKKTKTQLQTQINQLQTQITQFQTRQSMVDREFIPSLKMMVQRLEAFNPQAFQQVPWNVGGGSPASTTQPNFNPNANNSQGFWGSPSGSSSGLAPAAPHQ